MNTSLIKMKHFKGNIIMNNTTTRTDIINAFQSLDVKKPRITKGTKWNDFQVVKIEKLNNDYQIHLQDGDYKEVKSWETIKRMNNLKVEAILKQLDNTQELSDLFDFYAVIYNQISKFYYDSVKAS